jgi:hypothetical protein
MAAGRIKRHQYAFCAAVEKLRLVGGAIQLAGEVRGAANGAGRAKIEWRLARARHFGRLGDYEL